MNTPFSILYEDDDLVVINKPCGILVHRTAISEDTTFVLQRLRDQLQQRIYPVHRLDRATSGVLAFGKHKEAASFLGKQFQERQVHKMYLAIVRGYVEENATIDYALAHPSSQELQEAITHYQKLGQTEIQEAIGRYATARYSLVKITTETGRQHQIRRHFAHLRHPILGDKRHGDCKHNNYFKTHFDITRLCLHAIELQFLNFKKEEIKTQAPLDEAFEQVLELLNFAKKIAL